MFCARVVSVPADAADDSVGCTIDRWMEGEGAVKLSVLVILFE